MDLFLFLSKNDPIEYEVSSILRKKPRSPKYNQKYTEAKVLKTQKSQPHATKTSQSKRTWQTFDHFFQISIIMVDLVWMCLGFFWEELWRENQAYKLVSLISFFYSKQTWTAIVNHPVNSDGSLLQNSVSQELVKRNVYSEISDVQIQRTSSVLNGICIS